MGCRSSAPIGSVKAEKAKQPAEKAGTDELYRFDKIKRDRVAKAAIKEQYQAWQQIKQWYDLSTEYQPRFLRTMTLTDYQKEWMKSGELPEPCNIKFNCYCHKTTEYCYSTSDRSTHCGKHCCYHFEAINKALTKLEEDLHEKQRVYLDDRKRVENFANKFSEGKL